MTDLNDIIDFLNQHSQPFAELPEAQKPEMAERIKTSFKNLFVETKEGAA